VVRVTSGGAVTMQVGGATTESGGKLAPTVLTAVHNQVRVRVFGGDSSSTRSEEVDGAVGGEGVGDERGQRDG
jgi:hypothetical protein